MIENVSGDGTLYQKYFVNMSNSCFAEGLRGKKRKRIRKKFEKNSCPKIHAQKLSKKIQTYLSISQMFIGQTRMI